MKRLRAALCLLFALLCAVTFSNSASANAAATVDLNADGVCGAADAALLLRSYPTGMIPGGSGLDYDLTGNGTINRTDARAMLLYAVGGIPDLVEFRERVSTGLCDERLFDRFCYTGTQDDQNGGYRSENACVSILSGVTENSTFTTIMAINNFNLAIKSIELLKNKYDTEWNRLKQKIGFDEVEIEIWKEISKKAVINYDSEKKLYIEDDNFLKLEPLDMGKYKSDDTPLYHKISFDRLQRYMVLKQADIILLMALLPGMFTREEKQAAWDFYEPITLHDSTLSFGTHALFAARLGLVEEAYEYFLKSSRLDMDDIMHNTGKEGIHFASLGSTWQAVVNGFAGVTLEDDGISIKPNLPKAWKSLVFNIMYKGFLINVNISGDQVTLDYAGKCPSGRLNIKVNDKKVEFVSGKMLLY